MANEQTDGNGIKLMEMNDKHFPIAVVGIGCRFPGVDDMASYRKVLTEKLKTYDVYSSDRLDVEEWYDPEPGRLGYLSSKVAGLLPDVTSFDNTFFNISAREAVSMDPQQRMLMEVVQEALDDAGSLGGGDARRLARDTAAYVSVHMREQTLLASENRFQINQYMLTGGAHTVCANRINFFYDLRGASMGVEGSCTGSASSIHFGVWSLWQRECSTVIVGGANYFWSPNSSIMMSNAGYLSPDGRAAPFDEAANGTVRSEGCSIVILKPLADALRDNDHVHCLIRGSTLGYHGNRFSMQTYTSDAIAEVMQRTYSTTGLPLNRVSYVEANAAGFTEMDLLEVEAIGKTYASTKDVMKIGSCKANIGHLDIAASMPSLLKAILMVQNREFYPQANFESYHPALKADEWKVNVQAKHDKYKSDESFVVAVNTLSYSGQINHMIIEEYTNKSVKCDAIDLAGWKFGSTSTTGRSLAIPLSAKSKAALDAVVSQWLEFESDIDAQQVVSWLATRREHYAYRLVVFAHSGQDFREKMQAFLRGEASPDLVQGMVGVYQKRPICFVFPGQGQQWWHMGRALFANEPVYRAKVLECDRVWKRESGYSFLEKCKLFVAEGHEDVDPNSIDEIINCQPAIVSHQIGLYTLMEHWGIHADLVVGHSLGEYGSAYASRTLTLEDCMVSIFVRATTQSKLSGSGSMAAARMSAEEAEQFCSQHEQLYVACDNATGSVTLAGGNEVIARICEEMPRKLKKIRVLAAFHTEMVRPARAEYYAGMTGRYESKPAKGGPTFYSTVTGDHTENPCDVPYWWTNIETRVQFTRATKAILRDHPDAIFVEIGASATLLSCVRQTAQSLGITPAGLVVCGQRNKNDRHSAMEGFAMIHNLGQPVNWVNMTRNIATYECLPSYPFQRQAFYKESEKHHQRRLGQVDKSYKAMLGKISVQIHNFLEDYEWRGRLSFPLSACVEYLVESTDDHTGCRLENIHAEEPLEVLPRNTIGQYKELLLDLDINCKSLQLKTKCGKIQANGTAEDCNFNETMPKLDIAALRIICAEEIDIGDMYNDFSRRRINYGPAFRVVTSLRKGDGEAMGYLAPPTNKYERVQTVTLDGALQVAMAAFTTGSALYDARSISVFKMHVPRLPLAESLVVYTKLTKWCLDYFTADISIADLSGNQLVNLDGCTFENRPQLASDEELDTCMYTASLNEVRYTVSDDLTTGTCYVLHGCHDGVLADELVSRIPGSVIIKWDDFFVLEPTVGQPMKVIYVRDSDNENHPNYSTENGASLQDVSLVIEKCRQLAELTSCTVCVAGCNKPGQMKTTSTIVMNGYLRAAKTTMPKLKIRTLIVQRGVIENMASDIINVICRAPDDTVEFVVRKNKIYSLQIERQNPIKYEGPQDEWTVDCSEENLIKFRSTSKRELKSDEVRVRARSIGCYGKSYATGGRLIHCAGVVDEVGAGVTLFSQGDEVVALNISEMSSIFVCQVKNICKKPAMLSCSEASVWGMTYAVAYHALVERMHVQRDEHMLIHGGNALGRATIDIAKHLGTRVIATANDPTALSQIVRDTPVFDPRSISFIHDVMKHTGGHGVDRIIDTAGCDGGPAEIFLQCASANASACILNPTTRQQKRLVNQLQKVNLHIVTASDFIRRRPAQAIACMHAAYQLIGTDEARHTPDQQFHINDYVKMSEDMKNQFSTINIGDKYVPEKMDFGQLTFNSHATYIIVGGFGGVGMETARWLVQRGVRYLAMASRRGQDTSTRRLFVQHLRQEFGVIVYNITVDVGQVSEVARIFDELNAAAAPEVKGIFHAAAEMKDILDHSPEAFARMSNAQAYSAKYLVDECEKRQLQLDHFVLFSSTNATFDNHSVAEWSGVCNYVNYLSVKRRSHNVPLFALMMGPVREGGYTDTHPETASAMQTIGTEPMHMRDYLLVLEKLLQSRKVPNFMAVARQDWRKLLQALKEGPFKFEQFTQKFTYNPNEAMEMKVQTLRNELVNYLSGEFACASSLINVDMPLTRYGAQSFMAADLAKWVRQKYNVAITLKDVQDGLTVNMLMQRILSS